MGSRIEMTRHMLAYAYDVMKGHLTSVSLEEALFVPPGGYRSVLGTLKHAAAWSHVYRSYAFDAAPTPWADLDWPHAMRYTIIQSEQYLRDMIGWFDDSYRRWQADLERIGDEQLDEPRLLHWGQRALLYEIVVMSAGHYLYHAGELNQVLSICRGEAWEEGEEVEENNISTIGHRVRPPWLDQS